MKSILFSALFLIIFLTGCSDDLGESQPWLAIRAQFGDKINPDNPDDYAGQSRPTYITRDNTRNNPIENKKALLGRVLFYDKQLSIDNTVACASCHQQPLAFGSIRTSNDGVEGGTTARHSMRLVNSRFAAEVKFFWDERAATLEAQTTQPIQDHAEMGFSGRDGRPGFSDLIQKLNGIGYYEELFELAYGDSEITEGRIQQSIAQFIRSIQSFDSKFDAGRILVTGDIVPFSNFSQQENQGKNLFLLPPQFDGSGSRIGGGAGCAGCHAPPEFDISPNSRNNGVTGKINSLVPDFTVTRAPTLRDLIDANGNLIGPFMHDGSLKTLEEVIEHYNVIPIVEGNNNLDPKLRPNGMPQKLNLTDIEKQALVAFLKTLSGKAMYTDKKWSDPF
ncbi:MAG: cytochrome-c peroxidase [Cyclobacteriaceae bacterium]